VREHGDELAQVRLPSVIGIGIGTSIVFGVIGVFVPVLVFTAVGGGEEPLDGGGDEGVAGEVGGVVVEQESGDMRGGGGAAEALGDEERPAGAGAAGPRPPARPVGEVGKGGGGGERGDAHRVLLPM
jgi:hypothetical protein